jgi:hypothetical protein
MLGMFEVYPIGATLALTSPTWRHSWVGRASTQRRSSIWRFTHAGKAAIHSAVAAIWLVHHRPISVLFVKR